MKNLTILIILILCLCVTGCKLYSPTGTHSRSIRGDVNGDGVVDIDDRYAAADILGSHEGDDDWNPAADLNLNQRIDTEDLFMIAQGFTG